LPEPVKRKRFAVALWVFSLYLPLVFALRGTLYLLNFLPEERFQHTEYRTRGA
jgi:hypothetical protein